MWQVKQTSKKKLFFAKICRHFLTFLHQDRNKLDKQFFKMCFTTHLELVWSDNKRSQAPDDNAIASRIMARQNVLLTDPYKQGNGGGYFSECKSSKRSSVLNFLKLFFCDVSESH